MVVVDELDVGLLQALLCGASSVRAAAREAGTTPTTAGSRLGRLEEHGLHRGASVDLALHRLGSLVMVETAADQVPALEERNEVFQAWRLSDNRVLALALVEPGEELALMDRFPGARVRTVLEEVLHRVPQLRSGGAEATCAVCERRSRGQLEEILGDRRYSVCCNSCREVLRRRAGLKG